MIKQSVPTHELIVLAFHPDSKEFSELEWIDNHEFRYQGQMFDIVRQSTDTDGTVHYHCVNDKQEEILFAHLEEYVKNNTSNTSDAAKKNILKLFSAFCPSSNALTVSFTHTEQCFSYYSNDHLSPLLAIIAPPPRIA